MSIYALLNQLSVQFGDEPGPRAVLVLAVPPHIVDVGPSWDFLPPPVDPDGRRFRAIVVIEPGQPMGTSRNSREYNDPLLMMSGQEFHDIRFVEFMYRLEEALDAKHGQPDWKRVVGVEARRWYID